MGKNISLLDCTLRDGGHLVGSYYREEVIKNTIKKLVEAKVDIIEIGFLWGSSYSTDYTRYYTIEDVKRILPEYSGVSRFSLMSNHVDLEHLEPYDGTIEFIRLAFKRHKLDWALNSAKKLAEKGYKCTLNPVNCNVYTDSEYIEVLQKVNKIKPFGFSIVDTFGVMRKSDLSRAYYIVDNNLNHDINIGLHLHENLGLAYCLAQHFIEIAKPTRAITIDCSLLGMGRVPGNLCTEQIMDHLNLQYGKSYVTEPAFDAIDDYIAPIKKSVPWGYSTPYALSAKYKLHRTYAEHLVNKGRLKTKDIQRILSRIDISKAELFDEKYIEGLYEDYMDVKIDDTESIKNLGKKLSLYKNIVLIAPGASINQYSDDIQSYIDREACVISVNFNPANLAVNMVFCTNIKRYETISFKDTQELIITSNLMEESVESQYVLSYSELVHHDEVYCDDSTLMLLNLLSALNIQEIAIAGFDGYKKDSQNYYDALFEKNQAQITNNEKIKKVLNQYLSNMNIVFLTPSQYTEAFPGTE